MTVVQLKGDNALSDSGNTDSQDAVIAKPKRDEAVQETLASLSLLRSSAEIGPESSTSIVQLMLLAVSGCGHSWSV